MASSTSSTLPKDIIFFQILILLPLKSLTKFKCVCKSWYASLTDPEFLSLYTHQRRIVISSSEFPPFWLQSMEFEGLHDPVIEDQEFPKENIYELENYGLFKGTIFKCYYSEKFRVKILGSCHGLMLSRALECRQHFLWNPTTRACMKLPLDGVSPKDVYGIGFDSSSKEYKVVRVVNSLDHRGDDERINAVDIYSQKTNSWKRIDQDFPYFVRREIGAFVNGFLHWLAVDSDDKYLIVSLDLVGEKFHVVPWPDNSEDNNCIFHVGALEGLLCIVFKSYKDDGDRVWTIWVMKEYGVKESWTILMEIPCTVRTRWVKPLFVNKNGEVIMQVNGKKIVKYDQKREKFKTLLKFKFGIEAAVIRESLDAPMSPIAIAASKRCNIEK